MRKNGLLDWLDNKLGRVADSDLPDGTRKRSFGATVFVFWLLIDSVLLLAASYRIAFGDLPVVKGKSVAVSLVGWPIIGLACFVTTIVFLAMIFRREQDWKKLDSMFSSAIELEKARHSKGVTTDSSISKQLQNVLGNLAKQQTGTAARGGNPSKDLAEESVAEKLTGGG